MELQCKTIISNSPFVQVQTAVIIFKFLKKLPNNIWAKKTYDKTVYVCYKLCKQTMYMDFFPFSKLTHLKNYCQSKNEMKVDSL